MYTLGINAAFHDSAACLVKDGMVIAAAEEERFTGVKHGKRPVPFSAYELPFNAIDYCLREADIALKDVSHVAYSFDPAQFSTSLLHDQEIALPLQPSAAVKSGICSSPWDGLFLSYIVNAPRQLTDGAPHHLKKRFDDIRPDGPFRWHYIEHHTAHAASAFLASPFHEAAVMTLDGRGERITTSYKIGAGKMLTSLGEVELPHSLGLLYEKVTSYLGFLHSSDEYKVMALASYGEPVHAAAFRDMIYLNGDGTYALEQQPLEELFGPARERGSAFEKRHFNIARSLQTVLEETVLELAQWLHRATGQKRLCMAGGVALNCVMNARIRDEGPFKDVWVQPAAGDNGTALGAALWVDAAQGQRADRYIMEHAFLGPGYTDEEIENFLKWSKLPYRKMDNIAEETAVLLVLDRIVGWFQGRMEFGPRALGGRSIIASPLHAEMQAMLNEIKDREDFRPVAPVVTEENAADWFVGAAASPFMLFVYDVRPDKAHRIPAVRHVDGTARIQTVRREHNPRYYDVIKAFERRTGVPVLVNTSFNTRGKPIVCSPRDALECFWTSPIDALVMGPFLVLKNGVSP